jgi:membrane protease YdiL (CAAX protease family)
MRGAFGRWDWVANGSLWALFHFFGRWNYPFLLPLTLGIAFIARKTRSVYPVMLIHFIINFIPVLGILPLVLE